MKRFNSVFIVPVSSLEVGDLIAREFLGTVISGEVTGVVYAAYQLTDEQRAYMVEHDLEIPEDKYAALGGSTYRLVFGNFTRISGLKDHRAVLDGVDGHFYVEQSVNVAVFPVNDSKKKY